MVRNIPDNIDDKDPRAPWNEQNDLIDDDGNPVDGLYGEEDEEDDLFDDFGGGLYPLLEDVE